MLTKHRERMREFNRRSQCAITRALNHAHLFTSALATPFTTLTRHDPKAQPPACSGCAPFGTPHLHRLIPRPLRPPIAPTRPLCLRPLLTLRCAERIQQTDPPRSRRLFRQGQDVRARSQGSEAARKGAQEHERRADAAGGRPRCARVREPVGHTPRFFRSGMFGLTICAPGSRSR